MRDITPFQIAIPDSEWQDLRDRLRLTRWAAAPLVDDWSDGSDTAFLRELVTYWQDAFDWREQERRLNALPQWHACIDGQTIHFVHQRGKGPKPMPLVLTHGWPGSFIEMEALIPMLTDPAAFGGDPADAFDVVVPSLPGYGFSAPPRETGMNPRRIAALWQRLMSGLGYPRFVAQGGDIGAGVSMWLARDFPEQVAGFHLNYIPGAFQPSLDGAPPSPEEARYLTRSAQWAAAEGAYAALHATKPHTLAQALTDSPAGLAAWIVEKCRSWSDCDGDVTRVLSRDTLLTDISIYWFSRTIDASLRLYKESKACPLAFAQGERIAPPCGVAVFPREISMPPRSWVERVCHVQRWTSMPRGGHFAALEQPALLAEDLRAFCRPLRR
ncbi:epoxide hydrolase family protein [Robbsia sp. KACC 23696]|uniref:epoxide hydrolase family protein n=1 Tax=Robbsia sp. KACC 23696 TaxID=3149231 RepID=UPI00325A73CA